jgi:hypothetical protein
MDQKPLHFLVQAASFLRRISKTSLGLTPRRTFFDRDDGAALVGIDQRHVEPRVFLQERDVARGGTQSRVHYSSVTYEAFDARAIQIKSLSGPLIATLVGFGLQQKSSALIIAALIIR